MRDVAVVIVTHNAAPHLVDALRSVRAGLADHRLATITVVDNGSTDGTADLAAREVDVVLIRQANTGFAHGVNRGVSKAPPGHDVLVLNADLKLTDGCIAGLTAVLDQEPDAAIVFPRLVDEHGTTTPSLRRDPAIGRTLVEAVVGGRRAGVWGEAYLPAAGRADVDWATGAAMLVRREAFDQVGGLDESFFLYSEETEFCQRLRAAGYRVLAEPSAVAVHFGGAMAENPDLWALRAVNRARLYARNHGRVRTFAFRLAQLLFEARRAAMGDRVSRRAFRSLLVPELEEVACALIGDLGGRAGRGVVR